MITSLIHKNCLSPSIQIMMENHKKLIDELEVFENLFSEIKNIREGDKIGKCDEKYYIQGPGSLQRFHRWWNNENRQKTFSDIDTDYTKFFSYYDKIKYIYNNNFIERVLKIANYSIQGLYNLKSTYKDSEKNSCGEKLCIKVDSIILTLIDLKCEINCSLNKKPESPNKPRGFSF